jgi:hypothetical protein
MAYLLNTLKKYTIEEIPRLSGFKDRLRQYCIALSLICGSAFVIMLFHPTPIIAKLVIAFAFGFCFGLAIVIVVEGVAYLNNRKDTPDASFPAFRLWIYSALIFFLGFLLFSVVESYALKLERLYFLAFYNGNLHSYRPFSLAFLAKMLPIYLIIMLNAIRSLRIRKTSQYPQQQPGRKNDSIPINLGGDLEVLDFRTITHISVQEHYSRFYVSSGKSKKEIEAHLSLTNALASLPAEHFIRVHRSHAVNLLHVNGLRKLDNASHVVIGNDEFFVPVSRRQYAEVKKRIENYSGILLGGGESLLQGEGADGSR